MIAYTCKYAPVELLAGFGEACEKRNPSPASLDEADRLSHRNLCSFSRALLEDCLQRKDRGFLFTNCCDSMRRTCDVLQQAQGEGQGFCFLMDLPREDGPCARRRLAGELRRLIDSYAAYSGRPFDLAACMAAFPGGQAAPGGGPYLALLGARSGDGLLRMLEGALPLPVRDLTCMGVRALPAPPPGMDLDGFLDWYAAALLGQTPCMRMTEVAARRALFEDPHCRGILYHTVKFCDYYGFEYADIQKRTKLPLLKLETDGTLGAQGQMRTRVEAFAESLPHAAKTPARPAALPQKRGTRFFGGIDSGSTSTNVVLLDSSRRIVGSSIVATGARAAQGAQQALGQALAQAGLHRADLAELVATGYGRSYIGAGGREVTEITCHARGAFFLDPSVRTVIDIGGQDSKAIRIDANGAVHSFVMNDKCAAGTGRFLEMMARTLGLSMEQMGTLGLHWKEEIAISSMCTVFAESEVVSLVAQNRRTEDILHGLNNAVASKAAALAARVDPAERFMMTGGVAANAGVVRAIEEKLGTKLLVLPEHQLCGALGAALLAMEA